MDTDLWELARTGANHGERMDIANRGRISRQLPVEMHATFPL